MGTCLEHVLFLSFLSRTLSRPQSFILDPMQSSKLLFFFWTNQSQSSWLVRSRLRIKGVLTPWKGISVSFATSMPVRCYWIDSTYCLACCLVIGIISRTLGHPCDIRKVRKHSSSLLDILDTLKWLFLLILLGKHMELIFKIFCCSNSNRSRIWNAWTGLDLLVTFPQASIYMFTYIVKQNGFYRRE